MQEVPKLFALLILKINCHCFLHILTKLMLTVLEKNNANVVTVIFCSL